MKNQNTRRKPFLLLQDLHRAPHSNVELPLPLPPFGEIYLPRIINRVKHRAKLLHIG